MKQAPSLLHDQTFANVNEVLGTGTTTFDTNVLVKVEQAVKWAGSKIKYSIEHWRSNEEVHDAFPFLPPPKKKKKQ